MNRSTRQYSTETQRTAAGMTLMELLVATAILVTMILMFGTILTQSQRVVSGSQKTMRANSAASAIAQVIRNDLLRVTRNGMFCIFQMAPNGRPRLMYITAGPAPSKTHNVTGTGKFVYMGMCNNTSATASWNPSVMYYQGWILSPYFRPSPTDLFCNPATGQGYDMAMIQSLDRAGINNLLVTQFSWASPDSVDSPSPPASGGLLRLPPETINDVSALWQVLADKCVWLSIMWTDGQVDLGAAGSEDDRVNWYGIECYDNNTPDNPADDVYEAYGKPAVAGPPDPNIWRTPFTGAADQVEFDSGGGVYRALWTLHDQTIWPRAVKIRFKLEGQDPYEIICPVGG